MYLQFAEYRFEDSPEKNWNKKHNFLNIFIEKYEKLKMLKISYYEITVSMRFLWNK